MAATVFLLQSPPSMLTRTLPLLLALCALTAQEQKTVLECSADAYISPRGRDAYIMQFRVAPGMSMVVKTASLFVHVEDGTIAETAELALVERPWTEATAATLHPPTSWRSAAVKEQPKGWVRIDVPVAFAQSIAQGKGQGLVLRSSFRSTSRKSKQLAPYLSLQGTPQAKP
jgi:hypothetical protein